MSAISWEQDHAERMNAPLVTQLIRDAVPAIRFTEWRMERVDEGGAASLLPLNDATTNQHGTHQATLLALAADYTGGAAVAGLIRGVPVIGIHPQLDDQGMALWLLDFHMKYLEPSTTDLTIRGAVPAEQHARIRSKYAAGDTVVVTVPMEFVSSEGTLIAEGQFTYFLKQNNRLAPTKPGARVNALYAHRSKASARLIAGLRALETQSPSARFLDPWAAQMAGGHGLMLARRFSEWLPELPEMVAARTLDVDQALDDSFEQVVLLGAGFDMRPFRAAAHAAVFELDFAHMHEERARLLATLHGLPPVPRTVVPADLRLQGVDEALAKSSFEPSRPTLFVLEGVSMYQRVEDLAKIVASVARLLKHPNSRLWLDLVSRSVVERSTGFHAAERFVDGMRRLGEPFILGFDDPRPFFAEHGLTVARHISSGHYRPRGEDSALFGLYGFWHLAPSALPTSTETTA